MLSFKEYCITKYVPYFLSSTRNNQSDIYRINIILKDNEFCLKSISSITRNDIIMLFNRLKFRNISNSTLNRYHARVHAVLNHAFYEGILTNNPAKSIRKYKENNRERVLSRDEFIILIDECHNSKNKYLSLIVLIAAYTGMRSGEILKLQKKNIIGDLIVLEERKTKSGYSRKIPIHPHITVLIQEHIKFLKSDARLFNFNSIRTSFTNACKRAYIIDLRFHDLRRTCATALKNKDVNIHTISKILGHSSTAMTERYLATSTFVMQEAIIKLNYISS